ncbi:MAG: DNA/RNA non-specific endonuclease [Saprospiraceae bacterium]|nr:DNA/RNA non-specific endonuclease [Saprospiraceae bacterium]
MAKFRANHRRQGMFGGIFKLILLFAIGLIILLFSKPFISSLVDKMYKLEDRSDTTNRERFYLPEPQSDAIYNYEGFSLAYNEKSEQASWVAYELTVAQLNAPKVNRSDYFNDDPQIRGGSATYYDYKNSGYTKGHLVPAADRAYSVKTMEETFLMSNITPQTYAFNGGIWRELEEQTRDWARTNRSLYIVCGPIFNKSNRQYIGTNQVAVPEAFFKVILDDNPPELKGIGFIIPNERSELPLQEYAVNIDKVEEKTNLDFFYELFTNKLEDSIESHLDLHQWSFDPDRYRLRVENWNNR